MKLLFTIRTADRSPKQNYLRSTVSALRRSGVAASDIHVFPTDPDISWLWEPYPEMTLHLPDRRLRANENGIAPIALLDQIESDWIVLCEDDLSFCARPVESMTRWLVDHQQPDIRVYRFFALPGVPALKRSATAWAYPLKEMRGSQAVALRATDARDLRAWASAHPTDWRPRDAPFQDRPERGFDKLIGYWSLAQWPQQKIGLVSRPMMVNHVGCQSMLHSRGLRNDAAFAGEQWQYGTMETVIADGSSYDRG